MKTLRNLVGLLLFGLCSGWLSAQSTVVGVIPQYAGGRVTAAVGTVINQASIDQQGNFSIPVQSNSTPLMTFTPPNVSPYSPFNITVFAGPGSTNITAQIAAMVPTIGVYIGIPSATGVATNPAGYAIPGSGGSIAGSAPIQASTTGGTTTISCPTCGTSLTLQTIGASNSSQVLLNFTETANTGLAVTNPSGGNENFAGVAMGASGSSHAQGMAPDPGSTAGLQRYLREDGTWFVPPPIVPTVPGASAEYNYLDGTGTVVHDISGNHNDATFTNGPPVWYPYGLAFNDTGFNPGLAASITTPLTTFGSYFAAHCTANMGNTSGLTAALTPATNFQAFVATSSTTTGLMLYGNSGNNYLSQVSESMEVVTQPGFVLRSALPSHYGGCHIYGWTLTSPTDGLDHFTVDGVEPPSYIGAGSSGPSAPITGGTYVIGEDPFANSMRGVMEYSIFYPTALTVAQMQAVTRYIQGQIQSRPNAPDFPVPNNTSTPQLVFNGDSLTATLGGSYPWTNDVTPNNTYNITNYGVAGISALDTCKLYAQRWAQQIIPGQSTAVFWAGTNDFIQNPGSAQAVWNALAQCAVTAHQYGVRAVVASMISGTGRDTGKNELNALIRSQWKPVGFDGFVDLAMAPGIGADGAYSNTNCYQSDETHLTGPGTGTCETVTSTALSGYGVVAALMTNEINTLDGSSKENPDISASNAFVSTAANNFLIQTPTAAATYSLVDCQGQSTTRTIVNGSSSFAITVSAINSQSIKGSTSVAANAIAVFLPILTSPTVAGCSWIRVQ